MNQGPVTAFMERAIRKDKITMEKEAPVNAKNDSQKVEEPEVIEEIVIEELSIDGVCGVY
jgi:mycofactocin precursor